MEIGHNGYHGAHVHRHAVQGLDIDQDHVQIPSHHSMEQTALVHHKSHRLVIRTVVQQVSYQGYIYFSN